MEEKLSRENFFKHPRFWRHAIWILIIFCFYYLVPRSISSLSLSFKTAGFLEAMINIYLTFYLYNKFIPQKKYKIFAVFILIQTILSPAIDYYIIHDVFEMTSHCIGGFWGYFRHFYITLGLLFFAINVKLAFHGTKDSLHLQRIEQKQTESELKLLKSQINPHFLFNTLNNIYATNLSDHEKANDIILELADLLRYQLESNRKNQTKLVDEIASIENYIALEKIRVRDCVVTVQKSGNFEDAKIVPLLLIPFVENAFKYGTGIATGNINLRFTLSEDDTFNFYCRNTTILKKGKIHSGGIGLANVKKRLELMYPDRYQLYILQENTYFEVKLTITL